MRDSVFNTLKVAFLLCLVCSVLVSTAAVALRGKQKENQALDRKKNILIACGELKEGENAGAERIESLYLAVRPVLIDLESGERIPEGAKTYDESKALKDPAEVIELEGKVDRAKIGRIAKKSLVYEYYQGGVLETLVLPIRGKGLWSTLYGFLALGPQAQEIKGITFYAHGETPGLGGEVDNPNWKALWKGRLAFSPQGEVQIEVIKGNAGPVEEDPHRVDGLSGATITSRGVTDMLHFWLGDMGYGPFLKKLRSTS